MENAYKYIDRIGLKCINETIECEVEIRETIEERCRFFRRHFSSNRRKKDNFCFLLPGRPKYTVLLLFLFPLRIFYRPFSVRAKIL